MTFDPLAPARRRSAALSTGYIARISCPSSGRCVAVDGNGGELTFNPAAPAAAGAPTKIDPVDLASVACPTANECVAVGFADGAAITFNPRIPAAATSRPVDAGTLGGVVDVSCPSATQCTLIDDDERAVTFDPLSSARVRVAKFRVTSDLKAFACPAVNQCTAVDDRQAVTFNPRTAGRLR